MSHFTVAKSTTREVVISGEKSTITDCVAYCRKCESHFSYSVVNAFDDGYMIFRNYCDRCTRLNDNENNEQLELDI